MQRMWKRDDVVKPMSAMVIAWSINLLIPFPYIWFDCRMGNCRFDQFPSWFISLFSSLSKWKCNGVRASRLKKAVCHLCAGATLAPARTLAACVEYRTSFDSADHTHCRISKSEGYESSIFFYTLFYACVIRPLLVSLSWIFLLLLATSQHADHYCAALREKISKPLKTV